MIAFDLSIEIRRPPATVYSLLADIQEVEPVPHRAAVRMVKDPTGPTSLGTRWHEAVRLAPGCWFHIESVVSELDPPHLLGMDFSSRWLAGHLTYLIEPSAEGSILRQQETVRSRALPRWLLPAVGRSMRPRLQQRLADIKQILEAER